jgi:hypothetical protein
MEWTWQHLATLGLGLLLGWLWTRRRPAAPRPNPWAKRTTRDWDADTHGSALDGLSGHQRGLDGQGSDL